MYELNKESEKAILVGLQLGYHHQSVWQLAFEELAGLVETAGAEVVCTITQSRDVPEPATYIGKGKLQEILAAVNELKAEMVVFDCELSPAQVRNLEAVLPCKVLDRTQIILDIFAGRAQTKEGKLQVELAQLTYLLPRLTGKGTELSRLGGGIGTRGPGETKLESDRRRIRQRITDMRKELNEVRRHRDTQRHQRKKKGIPVLALVGYTNAGKSSLLRTIVEKHGDGAQRVSGGQNRLFDTLDPTARRIILPNGKEVIFTDTVGFIQQLPHQLIDAFRATLEETVQADLLLHVVDASHPAYEIQMSTVYKVLDDLGVTGKTKVTVLNKVDLVEDRILPEDSQSSHTIRISAFTSYGIPELIDWIMEWTNQSSIRTQLLLPYSEGHLISKLHEGSKIYQQEFQENGIYLDIDLKPEMKHLLQPYFLSAEQNGKQ
jgi:GTP-binding protein HflX